MPSDSTVFVDTDVLLYGEDSADGMKQSAAHAWLKCLWLDRRGRFSTQVLHEFYVNGTRKQHEQRIDKLRIVNPFLVGPEWLETSKALV